MEKSIFYEIVKAMTHHLRSKVKESYYETAKSSGLRIDTIRMVEHCAEWEDATAVGAASSWRRYIDSFCERFPDAAYIIFYNLSIAVAQRKEVRQ